MALRTRFSGSIRLKMMLSFLIVIALVVILGLIAGIQSYNAQKATRDIYPHSDQTRNIQNFALALDELDGDLLQLFAIGGIEQNITDDLERLQAAYETIEADAGDALQPILETLDPVMERLNNDIGTVIDPGHDLKNSELNRKILSIYQSIETAKALHQQLTDANLEGLRESVDTQSEIIQGLFVHISVVGAVVCALVLGISIIWSRVISKPIIDLRDAVQRIGDGDLDAAIKLDSNDELGQLTRSFNTMMGDLRVMIDEVARVSNELAAGNLDTAIGVEMKGDFNTIKAANNTMIRSLRSLVGNVKHAADRLARTSQDLASSSEEMNASTQQVSSAIQAISQNANQQASEVGETVSIMRVMANGVETVAATANSTTSVAARTKASGARGQEVVKSTVAKMEQIYAVVNSSAKTIRSLGERSEEISSIVDVITGITDQTNLLALNAAIEAARAGEHGRGFAVVADEVKNLAEDSRNAAARIAEMVDEIQTETQEAVSAMERGTREVEAGRVAVDETDEIFSEILSLASTTADEVALISAAMEEQRAGTDEVAAAVDTIATVAEETAAAAEESASSTEELTASMEETTARAQQLSEMATTLERDAAKFRLRRSKRSSRGARRRRPHPRRSGSKADHRSARRKRARRARAAAEIAYMDTDADTDRH